MDNLVASSNPESFTSRGNIMWLRISFTFLHRERTTLVSTAEICRVTVCDVQLLALQNREVFGGSILD